MQELRQSTATAVIVGPFLDETDGITPEEALTVASIDTDLYKFSNTHPLTATSITLTTSGGSNDCVHVNNGYYSLELTTTDSNTLGRMRLTLNISGAVPVWEEFAIIPANVWDARYSTDYLQVDTIQIEGVDATNQINAECDQALTDYDPPTMAEMDTGHGLLATEAKQDIIDTVVDAILADTGTDGVVLATGAVNANAVADNAITADSLVAAVYTRIADFILKRNMATCRASSDGDKTGRFILQAFAFLRNYRFDDSGTLRVKQEDDITDDWTAALGTNPSANPVDSVDPT